MRRELWISVFTVSIACIIWASFLDQSSFNDKYIYGYRISGLLCVSAFIANHLKRRRTASTMLIIGSFIYITVPANTFVRLLIFGEWQSLLEVISAASRAPTIANFSKAQTALWFIDLYIFQIAFAIYFITLLSFIAIKSIFKQ